MSDADQRAWDMYAAAIFGMVINATPELQNPERAKNVAAMTAAMFADALLEERRKRFGVGR